MSEDKSNSEDRKNSHLENIPEWPDFKLFVEYESGRIPTTKVKGWRHFSEILEEGFFNRYKTQLVYRGHRRFDWPLTPSLGRLDHRGIISNEVAEEQISFFRKAVRGRILDRTLVDLEEVDELWAVGQHHGLMTPLLDWTYSPYVALFFAFEKPDSTSELDNPYRTIYVLNKSYIEGSPNPIQILEPRKDDHGRLVNQAGLFTLSEFGDTLENQLINSLQDEEIIDVSEEEEEREFAKYICKIYIPNEDRDECIQHLRRMNVHHASLFPDLQGAAEHSNAIITELKKQEDLREAEKELEKEEQDKTAEEATEIEIPDSLSELIENLLKEPEESKQVEAGRIRSITKELATEIEKHQFADWIKRDSVQAQLRVFSRVILRKYGYPKSLIETFVNSIVEKLKEFDQAEEE